MKNSYKVALVAALAVAGFTLAGIASGQHLPGQTTATTTTGTTQQSRPRNTAPPSISGTPIEGTFLTGHQGGWNGADDFEYRWLRCDRNGGSCSAISGATSRTYRLTNADVGNTIRFRVTAENEAGSTTATSVPTAVVREATTTQPPAPPPPPSRGSGCPAGNASTDQVGSIAPPARLLVDRVDSNPRVVPGSAQSFTVRVHVTSSCGGNVQGALVYATAVPFNMVSIPPEQATGSDGWVELRFNDINFPVTPRQQLLVLFVRARKPGESLLGGISTRRLVSVRVNPRA